MARAKSISVYAANDVSRSISMVRSREEKSEDESRTAGNMQRRSQDIRMPKVARSHLAAGTRAVYDRHGSKQRVPDWHNLFNTFFTRWGHRRRRGDAALTAGVITGLRRGSAHVATCRRQFGCHGNSTPAGEYLASSLSLARPTDINHLG